MSFQAQELRIEFARRNVTHGEVAKKLDVSRQAISNWVNGHHGMTPERLFQVLRALGYSDDDLRAEPMARWYDVSNSTNGS